MLYELNDGNELKPLGYFSFKDKKMKEKDLENLLTENLRSLFLEGMLPIFNERNWQEEADICAIDSDGNVIIFELKIEKADGNVVNQIMRYAQKFGKYDYEKLNEMFIKYQEKNSEVGVSLQKKHKEAFGLEECLAESEFNKEQKLIIVANSADYELIENIEYWKSKGVDIDFLPYRLYDIEGKIYFEFFAKPYDYHVNLKNKKGIIFDTNKTYGENFVLEMIKEKKISAYGDAKKYIKSFNKGDYVLYYHVGKGIIAIGKIKTLKPKEILEKNELYHEVEFLTPKIENSDFNSCPSITAKELKDALNKGFYFASTMKTPFLTEEETKILIELLKEKYKSFKNGS